jgi:hypothetical protein
VESTECKSEEYAEEEEEEEEHNPTSIFCLKPGREFYGHLS